MIGLRGVARVTFALGLAASLLGCPLLKKKGDADAGADAGVAEESLADAATVVVAGSGAKNERDVVRYAKEEKIADEAAVVGKDATKVRTFPGTGVEVATLPKGTGVVKIAKYFSSGVLITFDEPASGSKLMGWVPPEALSATAAATPTTTATYVPVKTTDAGIVDAGPSGAKDAGVVTDAGAADAGKPAATTDAGALSEPAKGVLVVQPTDGKCPTGFALLGQVCRRPCNADTDCPRSTFCVVTAGVAGSKKSCSTSK